MLRPSARLRLRDLLYDAFSRDRFNELLEAVDVDASLAEQALGSLQSKGSYMLKVLKELGSPSGLLPGVVGREQVIHDFVEVVLERLKDRNPTQYEQVRRLLDSEGIEIGPHGIRAVAGELARPGEEENALFAALQQRGLGEVIRYLEQSQENYVKGNWEASNAMTRTALEKLTSVIAETISAQRNEAIPIGSRAATRPQPADIRRYLRDVGFMDGNEFNLLEAFYQFCSPGGSHPGLSDESDCRLRRFILVALCLEYLEKADHRTPAK